MKTATKVVGRRRRHARVRKRIVGTADRPRLAVYRSNKHIYAQIIDDGSGRTLAAAASVAVESGGTKSETAKRVGALVGQRAVEAGITAVVFDRGGNRFMGRVREVAEGAREAGLKF